MVQFKEVGHKYESIVPDGMHWISVTTLIHNFVEPFDASTIAAKSSKNKKSKWFGLSTKEIENAWTGENRRATDLGSWYHKVQEDNLFSDNYKGSLPVFPCIVEDGVKKAPSQILTTGLYPEHLMYMSSVGLCGQSDHVSVEDGYLNIKDYKTNKEIRKKGYENWEGTTKKMLQPLTHLDDCEFNHYSLQLSIYAYMILRHNPELKIGKLSIEHVSFEEEGTNKYGYPITKLSKHGEPVVKEVTILEVPYLKSECITLITWLKNNRNKIKKH